MCNSSYNIEEKYYLYRHIRPDKDEPFYIGIGAKTKQDLQYYTFYRSYDKRGRNNLWHSIVDKNNGKYDIEILFESNDHEFIKTKEVEFIKLYGRIIKEDGILANYTDGGSGKAGYKLSDEQRKALSEGMKGRKPSRESIEKAKRTKKERGYKPSYETGRKISIQTKKRWRENPPKFEKNKIYQYSISGELVNTFENGEIAEALTGFKRLTLNKYCRGNKNHFYNKCFWFYEYKGETLDKLLIKIDNRFLVQPVLKLDMITGEVLAEFKSTKAAGESIRKGTTATGCIREVLIGGRQKQAYGFYWKFKD